MKRNEILENLCYYDLRNPEGISQMLLFTDLEDVQELIDDNKKKEYCACDNCYEGRTALAEELLKYIKE